MRLIVLLAVSLAACTDSAGEADAAPQAPPCPTGGEVGEDTATCGPCTEPHTEGQCAEGYVCTCARTCTWFEVFPLDAGVAGCGGIDAGTPDGG